MADEPDTSGLDLGALRDDRSEDRGGTGGQSGGGATAGAGVPAGGTLDAMRGEADAPVRDPHATPRPDSLAGVAGSGIAGEAAALGSADGALADAAGPPDRARGGTPTLGEAVGSGAGRGEPGSGTPGDRGELGGGDPLRVPR